MLGNNHQMISLQMYRNFASKILGFWALMMTNSIFIYKIAKYNA